MFESLRSLSDHEVISRTETLVARERKLTLSVLSHLMEIERRKLFLKAGHGSMFLYCTTGLGYSASAAKRRICTARCVARFPEVLRLLETNEVNLSTVTQVSRILGPENGNAILARIRGKSQREVEAIVAEYEPLAALPRERVRTVVVRVPVQPATASTPERPVPDKIARNDEPESLGLTEAETAPSPGQGRNGPEPEPAVQYERRALIQFAARECVMTKLENIRSLASHRLPANAPLEQVIEFLADYFTEREDPKARHERREARKQAKNERGPGMTVKRSGDECKRGIPARVRDEVFVRNNGRCAYVGARGRQCESKHVLQVDHIKPVARGGASTPDNLRLLCAHHNRLEAERLMGRSGPPGR